MLSSQLHREALAVIFAVKKFHKFIFGHKVIIYSDCKALESILTGKKFLGTVINSRFLRWIFFLQNYDVEVWFRPSGKTQNADALSRLPMDGSTLQMLKSAKLSLCVLMYLTKQLNIQSVEI